MADRQGSWIIRGPIDDGQLWRIKIWKKVIWKNVTDYGLRKWNDWEEYT